MKPLMEMITFLKQLKESLEGMETLKSFMYDIPKVLDQLDETNNDSTKDALNEKRNSVQSDEEIIKVLSDIKTVYQRFYSRASFKHFGFLPQLPHKQADEYGKACICALLIAICYYYLHEKKSIRKYAHLALENFNSYCRAMINDAYIIECSINPPRPFKCLLLESPVNKVKNSLKNERKELFEILSKLAWDE